MKNLKNWVSLILVVTLVIFVYNFDTSTTAINTTNSQLVAISGESFGIKLYTKGVLVISTAPVQTKNGDVSPAEDAGMMAGDIIVSLNNKEVTTCKEVANVFECSNGSGVKVIYERNEETQTTVLKPALNVTSDCYKAGMWIRDSTAGIGTITYYDTKGNYGALGHGITDVDTGTLMPLGDGEALKSSVIGLSVAEKGKAGEIYGVLETAGIGSIKINCEEGIYGTSPVVQADKNYIESAQPSEIEKGPAKIAATIDESGVRYFDIEITRISKNSKENKDMIIKITDEELLEKTGGILQGMSGSPIVQNGKFVGAVTHVFLNKPEQGYAIFASKMLDKSSSL